MFWSIAKWVESDIEQRKEETAHLLSRISSSLLKLASTVS